ncbi:hypothetical protein IX317_001590 [Fusobacterium sp. DD29]|uniref:flavodoxin family protein n=1 Tax=unclassified Fusobacterium TaxID=2648384 RepID=UPI001B8D41A9|nr:MULTISPECIES: flavodoxin family protein [unclassified Fusobacterium]MBR8701389.1 hypothetical protein [Fusobacterium sp. DD45]MBR8711157.1 hypothetical protein [Fusobacterium sp. DD28]MBR8749910.1 hypothetical protein [Fusobacterium sp. DD29]MBR8751706.1 hypothetical protein [Fusobacterium sp. DD26]MBR8762146.1 hypothetical protein [Fusobacterium sp. DD25]
MNKILVAYSSVTGNTKKVATAISEALEGSQLKDIKDVETLDYDVIIVGAWIRRSTADPKALAFIDTIKNKKTAFFFTLGAYPDSEYATRCIKNITEALEKNGNEVLGHFHCHGALSDAIIQRALKRPAGDPHGPTEERMKRWKDASTHPDATDLKNAQEYFSNIIK